LDIPSLDAYLCDLDTIGVFEKITGLLVSVPYGYTKEQQQELEKLIITYTEKYTYPIILNFPLGHTQPMLTLPLMAEMEIDSQQKIIRYAL
jgi:muramoyltetrapeptide carboxypeptidase